jgi:putative transposase
MEPHSIEELNRLTEELKRNSNSRKPATLKAKKYLIEQLIARGYTRREIAEKLGVSRKTIYNIRNCLQ